MSSCLTDLCGPACARRRQVFSVHLAIHQNQLSPITKLIVIAMTLGAAAPAVLALAHRKPRELLAAVRG